MPRRAKMPLGLSVRSVGGLASLLVLAGAVVGLGLTMLSRSRTNMVDAKEVPPPSPAPIDGDRAYGYLKAICAIGPRPAGSAANTRQRQMVAEHFKKMGASVREQTFNASDPRSGARVTMVNLIGSWHPERPQRVVLGAHYDTRPFPDQEPDLARRTLPFIGANDGASGVALLMEIAHHLNTLPTPWGVDLVLFDGEELVYGKDGDYFLGSYAFARAYRDQVRARKAPSRYVAGIVLDMVGDRNLQIDQEPNSLNFAPRLVHEVWGVARQIQATAFRNQVGRVAVSDDHLPLNEASIPTIDIIDFEYPYWHTSQDLPEQCSGESLAQVGRVVTAWLAQAKARGR